MPEFPPAQTASRIVSRNAAGRTTTDYRAIIESPQPADIHQSRNAACRITVSYRALILRCQPTDIPTVSGLDIYIFHSEVFYLAAGAHISKQADTVSADRIPRKIPNPMVIAIEDAGELCCAVCDDVELRAGEFGKINIVHEDKLPAPVFFVITDVIKVFCCCDSVRVVRLTGPAAIFDSNPNLPFAAILSLADFF